MVMTFGLLPCGRCMRRPFRPALLYRLGIATALAQAMEKLMSEPFLSNDPRHQPDLAPMGLFLAVDVDGLDDLPGAMSG